MPKKAAAKKKDTTASPKKDDVEKVEDKTTNSAETADDTKDTASTSTTTTTATDNGEKKRKTAEPKASSPTVTSPTTVMETRARKKAREALDLISGAKQRQSSVFNLLGDKYTGPSEQQLQMIFRLFCNRKGQIGAEELAAVLRSMGKRPLTKRIDKILNECDANRNGTIEMDEFVEYMQKKAMEKAKLMGLITEESESEGEDQGGDTDEEDDKTPKKKAAGTIKKKTATKKTKKDATASTTTTLAKQPSFFQPLQKHSSIVQFYNPHAGVHTINNVQVDKFNNPVGVEYDLGVEGAFTSFTILFGIFYTALVPKCEQDLKNKGFNVIQVKTQKEFIESLPKADVAIIISGKENDNTTTLDEFTLAVKGFHESGKGLFLWADNVPWTVHTQSVVTSIFGNGYTVAGNERGNNDLTLAKGNLDKKTFASHLITSGIVSLYEGITVSNVAGNFTNGPLDVLAKSTEGNNVMVISNNNLAENCGRVVIDCGFTKLMNNYYNAGVERYIKNACVWLLALDHRFRIGVAAQGSIEKPKEAPLWQYKHGDWLDYDKAASDIVEEAYIDWQKNPYVDIRSVQSGHWQYHVDFRQMKQTNIQHSAHTQRDIRRIMKPIIA